MKSVPGWSSPDPRLQRSVLIAFGSAWLLAATGCGSLGVQNGPGTAQVRFVAMSPGTGAVDFTVNGTGVAYGVGFDSFTSYMPVNAGVAGLGANRSATGQALVTAEGMLSSGRQYTAVLSHGASGLQERVFEDQQTPAPAGEIALRVLNVTGGVSAITVYITPLGRAGAAPEVMLSVASGTVSPYMNLPVENGYKVTAALNEGNLNLPVESVPVKVDEGAVRTVVFGGTAREGGVNTVAGFSLVDAEAP